MLKSRRTSPVSELPRTSGRAERMSPTAGGEASPGASLVATERRSLRPPLRGRFPRQLPLEDLERAVRRLARAAPRDHPGLPAGEAPLVLDQEPDEHVDPPRLLRHRDGLLHVAGLVAIGDAEEAVGRVR